MNTRDGLPKVLCGGPMANRLQQVGENLFWHRNKLKTYSNMSMRFSPTIFGGEFVIRNPAFYLNIPDYGGFGGGRNYHDDKNSVSFHSHRSEASFGAVHSMKTFPLPIPVICDAQYYPSESPSKAATDGLEEWLMTVAPIPYMENNGTSDAFAFVLSPKSDPLKFWIAHFFTCRIALSKRNGKLRIFGVDRPEEPPAPATTVSSAAF